jgi:Tropinone reductase 1
MSKLATVLVLLSLLPALVLAGSRWSLKGKNIVVTGGSKGIGRACVDELCGLGANVITCARNSTELEACNIEWSKRGYQVHSVVSDVSSEAGRQSLVDAVNARFGGTVDSLVNNVGINIRKRAIEYSDSEYERIMGTNLNSAFSLTMRFHPFLKRATNGASVVNIGSVGGKKVLYVL